MLVCLAASGCGGDDEDGGGGSPRPAGGGSPGAVSKEAVFAGLREYGEAVEANDPAAACDKLTPEAQDEAAQTFPDSDSCEDAHRRALRALGEANRERLAEQLAGVTDYEAKVSGNNATLTFPRRPEAKPLRMKQVDGDWKVDQNPLFFNRQEE
jgi:hypothetical protein